MAGLAPGSAGSRRGRPTATENLQGHTRQYVGHDDSIMENQELLFGSKKLPHLTSSTHCLQEDAARSLGELCGGPIPSHLHSVAVTQDSKCLNKQAKVVTTRCDDDACMHAYPLTESPGQHFSNERH